MSHADGLAILPDGKSYYFEYDGTSDICCTRLYTNYEDLHNNWREDNSRECTCHPEKKHSVVMLTTSYAGWHFLFMSNICEECLSITGKISED